MKSFVAALLATYVAASTVQADAPWAESGVMVDNADISQQADTFDWNAPFISEENYVRGVNLESDVLIAIEAIRIEVIDIRTRLEDISNEINDNEDKHTQQSGEYNEILIKHDDTKVTVDEQAGQIAEIKKEIDQINTHIEEGEAQLAY